MPKLIPAAGSFKLTPAAVIRVQPENEEIALIARCLSEYLPFNLKSGAGQAQPGDICLQISGKGKTPEEEGYRLEVQPERVTVEAAVPSGLFHGVQTLRQMFPPVPSNEGPAPVKSDM